MNYSVSITNNDSAGCTATNYALSSTQPSGWPSSFSAGALLVAPAATGSVTWTLTVPAGTAPATYATSISGTGGAVPGSANFNCTVLAAPLPLTVSVTPGSGTYSAKTTPSFTAKVLNGSTPQSGATVRFTVTAPNGSVDTGSATTNSTGQASWSFKLNPKDPKGVYNVTAAGTYGVQTGTGATQFTVQ
jgi:hypothetical protein